MLVESVLDLVIFSSRIYVEISVLFKSSALFLEQGERGALAGLLTVLFKRRVYALSAVLKLVVSAA